MMTVKEITKGLYETMDDLLKTERNEYDRFYKCLEFEAGLKVAGATKETIAQAHESTKAARKTVLQLRRWINKAYKYGF